MNISEKIGWPDHIYQISRGDRVEGGADGVANIQAKQLADRTQFLKTLIESASDYREYTFFKSESDPDGTIAGLANTPAGKMFRVAQDLSDELAFIYYLNDSGSAVALTALLGRGAIINNVREYPTLILAQNDTVAGNILDGTKCRVTNLSDSTLTDEYINNGGTLEATGRQMPSRAFVEQINTRLSDNIGPRDVTTDLDYRDGYVINADGSVVDGSAAWRGYWMNVRAGDKARYEGPMGSSTEGETIAVFIQFDLNGVNQGNLATYTSTGAVVEGLEFEAEATHDGLIYVRALIGSG
ncbi:TPA: hypothetical protein NHV37_002519, partial [Klebsiella michiganensis]|nr:hypothetical protein [Klebsiella michiganensis]HCE9049796.1 hypothetical protein [Klebsiella michiganensis]